MKKLNLIESQPNFRIKGELINTNILDLSHIVILLKPNSPCVTLRDFLLLLDYDSQCR